MRSARRVWERPRRAQIAAIALEATRARQETFIIANNKAEGSAPLTIRKLADLVRDYGETIVIL